MVTIKEIAKMSGFSVTTVSLVLSGHAHERKISQKTRDKITNVANDLGYRVNIAARRLRTNQTSSLMISVFMVMDQRAQFMLQFLMNLQDIAEIGGQPFEIVVHFYRSDFLHDFAETIRFTNCAIICNASERDLRFLDEAQFSVPFVLFYRASQKYSSVNINWHHVGELAASIFARRGRKRAALLSPNKYFHGLEQCGEQFLSTASQNGMSTVCVQEPYDARGGYHGGLRICGHDPLPDCVFTVSGAMANGMLRAFSKQDIKVPEQIELICMGSDDNNLYEFANVAISTISVSVRALAEECMKLLFLQLDGKIDEPLAIEVPVSYVRRESCGE